jgi:peptidoglycan hydrolase-like protein with peptidoglycan-binding domain
MRRRSFILGVGAISLGLTAGVARVVLGQSGDSDGVDADGAGGDPEATAHPTATVARRDLEERTRLTGRLGYGEVQEVSLSSGGTITALPALGSVIDQGQTLIEVDGVAVPLLFGARPLWRELGPGVEDGPDVEQVEANLVALGFAPPGALTVDQHWTSATTSAVNEWQRSLGRPTTGVVSPADVVVLPAAVRVAGHPTAVGAPAQGPIVEVSGNARLVTVDLEASRQRLVTGDQAVQVELPDGTIIAGRVAAVGRVARRPDDSGADGAGEPVPSGELTVDVSIELDDPGAAGAWDEVPVTVHVVSSVVEDALAVPVVALLALSEGGFAVERVVSGGGTRLVAVETGAFADGWVQVTSEELTEGDDVVVPE